MDGRLFSVGAPEREPRQRALDAAADASAVSVYPLVPARTFDEPLTYIVPTDIAEQIDIGSIVEIPLGTKRRVGVVSDVDVARPAGVPLKAVVRVIDAPRVSPALLRLAEWIATQYGCARTVALSLVVGPRLAAHARASAVPTRARQHAVRRRAVDLGGLDLTARQRDVAQRIPPAWTPVAPLLERLATTRGMLAKLADAGVVDVETRFLDETEAAAPNGDLRDAAAATVLDHARDLAAAGPRVLLTERQRDAVDACWRMDDGDPATLLVGITGSGKTEVYLEVIARALDEGRGAIVLVPEIALTPQTSRRFQERFPGIVEVLHSAMTKAQRAAAHDRIACGDARVVVGPRSAIFAPVHPLGVVVVDEEHDSSYKQDGEPRYDARRVAYRRALGEGARLVLGSATPRPESWHAIRHRVLLRERPGGGRLAPVELIDLRDHRDTVPLTQPVRDAVSDTLARGRKAIILHNRRGYAVAVHCRSCGTTIRCPRCDVSLVTHGTVARRQRLTCHHCGFERPLPSHCDACGSADIARMGAGTQQIESIIESAWPTARVHRLDADAVRARGAVHDILEAFGEPGPALLIGTQMVAKGHDFPDVELAVVIDADASLAIPDFRSDERAFSLVAQLAGRAGRSAHTAEHARVLVQTWDPEHPFLRFARTHDVEGFLERELGERRAYGYPPFTRLVRVMVSARDSDVRDRWAVAVRDGLAALGAGDVRGPAPLMRINERERSQVIISTHRAVDVAAAMRRFLQRTDADRRKVDVRIVLDVDPQSLM